MPAKPKLPRTTPAPTPEAPWHASRNVRLGAVAILAVAAAVTIAIVVGTSGTSSPATPKVAGVGPVALSARGLKNAARDLNQVIYWVGPVKGDTYELTRTTDNNVYVRYLPRGVKAGEGQGKYLLVGTYPFVGALAGVKAGDNGPPLKVAGAKGAIAAVELGRPTNVHVAFPHVDYQLEIYDPSPREARKLATSGALTTVP